MSLIKQSLQVSTASDKDPEQEMGAENLPHDSEQHEMKNYLVGKACNWAMQCYQLYRQ